LGQYYLTSRQVRRLGEVVIFVVVALFVIELLHISFIDLTLKGAILVTIPEFIVMVYILISYTITQVDCPNVEAKIQGISFLLLFALFLTGKLLISTTTVYYSFVMDYTIAFITVIAYCFMLINKEKDEEKNKDFTLTG